MAGHHVSSLKPNEISENFRVGAFALRWSDENNKSTSSIAVHLSVDPKGFYLLCLNKITKETECFDIALIHDTRTGLEVSLPRGAAECEHYNIGVLDVPLWNKWLTIYYGNSFIPDRDLRIIHFCFPDPTIAREWAEQLFHYSRNPLLRNLSALECLEKAHSKIINSLTEDRLDKRIIPVRSIIQFFCRNARDIGKETKILKALELLELPFRTDTFIDPEQFTFNKFVQFYMQLMERHEIDKLFDATGGKHRRYLSCEKVRDFILKQNDAHGNALGLDYYDKKAKDLVRKYTQHDKHFLQKGMSDESFLRYLLSFDNLIVDPSKLDLFMDMDKPLAHYFISSSHNTYLTGSQLTGRASAEMYRQVLLTGCRCIELDVVDSERKSDEPEIKHKNTPVRSVSFVQVIAAIRDSAFKASPYPVILSLENHCSPKVQALMAQYLVDILGDYLVTQPLKSHPCQPNCPLPSPNDLKYKILIKNKKLHENPTTFVNNPNGMMACRKTDSVATTSSDPNSATANLVSTSPTQFSITNMTSDGNRRTQMISNEVRDTLQAIEFDSQLTGENSRNGILIEEGDQLSSSDDDISTTPIKDLEMVQSNVVPMLSTDSTSTNIENPDYSTQNIANTESKATKAMSDLVHYIVPIRFVTFARAEERNRSYEISSFSEDRAQNLIRDYAREFVAYNQRQLSRIYPRGTRIDSSNYNPYSFWPVGCQLVALNYQTLDTPMQVNLGLFSLNGACGYIEKPSFLCQSNVSFDPKGRASVENVVVYQIEIKIISGQFLCQDREPTYVDVEMYGMYADATKRHEYRSKAKRWNGFQAVYDDSDVETGDFSIRFSKVILPEMASLRFAVSEEDGTFVGQSFIPVAHLRSGYRHVVLRNQINIPVQTASLFIYIRKDVHVDDENRELINQLVSPTSAVSTSKETTYQKLPNTIKHHRSHSVSDLYLIPQPGETDINRLNEDFLSPKMKEMQGESSSSYDIDNLPAPVKRRNQSTPFVYANLFHAQLIASSQLYDQENLCRILPLDDLENNRTLAREQEKIQGKIRKATLEYDKKILIEEERFQKCLARQNTGSLSPLTRRTVPEQQLSINSIAIPHGDGRTTSFSHQNLIHEELKQVETRLLDLYSNKFHLQNELEYKHSKAYYNEIEKYTKKYYQKQMNRIEEILKQEQSKVKEDIRVHMKNETKRTVMTETDRDKIPVLKNKIRQMNVEAAALAIGKLEEMHNQLLKRIEQNFQNARNKIQNAKDSETKTRFNKYSNQLNEVKVRLRRAIYGEDYSESDQSYVPSSYRTPMTSSASLSAILDQPMRPIISPTFNTLTSSSAVSDSLFQQQRANNTNSRNYAMDDAEEVDSSNSLIESTRL